MGALGGKSAGTAREVARPAGVEGWLPIAGLMQFKYVVMSGQLPRVHPAAFFLFTAFLRMSWLLRKSFCSWLCPVGTFSEYLWKLGRFIFRRNFALPRWLDIPLRGLKYLLLAFFAYAVYGMSAIAIEQFLASPYGLIVDVRMLNFFRYLSGTAAYVVLGLVVASIFVQNFWCRYLCPYGALLGLAALASPVRITRRGIELHRLREVREGLSVGVAGGQAGADSVGGVHGMFGVRGGLSGERDAGDFRIPTFPNSGEIWANQESGSGVGVRGGDCGDLLWAGGVCEGHAALGHAGSAAGVLAAGADGE